MDLSTLFWGVDSVAVAAVLGWGLVMLNPPHENFRAAKFCFWGSALLWWGVPVVWGSLSAQPFWVRGTIVAALTGIGAVALMEVLRVVALREDLIKNNSDTPAALYNSQFSELDQLDKFIGRGDENDLRELFDFPRILDANLKMARNKVAPLYATKESSDEINSVFAGGQAMIDIRYANVTVENNTAKVDWIPGNIGVINLTLKHFQQRKQLQKFANSPHLPEGILQSLKNMDNDIGNNLTTMIVSLNESLHINKNTIIENFDYNTPYYGSASGLYWAKFKNLRPDADKITLSIREYLKVR